MKNYCRLANYYLLLIIIFAGFSFAQVTTKSAAREMDFDEAGEEETLNRKLWESVKKTPYENALRHIVQSKQTARPRFQQLPPCRMVGRLRRRANK